MDHNRGSIVFQAIIGLFIVGAIAAFSFNSFKRVKLSEQQSKYAETQTILHNASIILSRESLDEDGDLVQEPPLWDHIAGQFRIPSNSKAPRKDAWGNELIYCPFDYGDEGVSTYSYVHVTPSVSIRGGIRVKVPSSQVLDIQTAPAFAIYSVGPFNKSSNTLFPLFSEEEPGVYWESPCINTIISSTHVAGNTSNALKAMPPNISFEWGPKAIVSNIGMDMLNSGSSVENKRYSAEIPDPAEYSPSEMVLVEDSGSIYFKNPLTDEFKPITIRGTSFNDLSRFNLAEQKPLILDGNDNTDIQSGDNPDYLYGSRYSGIFLAQSKEVGSLFVNIANSDCQIPLENPGTLVDAAFMCGITIGRISEAPTSDFPNVQNNMNNMRPSRNPGLVVIGHNAFHFGSGENSIMLRADANLSLAMARMTMVKRDLDGALRNYLLDSTSVGSFGLPALSVNNFKVFDEYGVLNLPTIVPVGGGTCPDKDRGGMAIDSNGDVYVCQ